MNLVWSLAAGEDRSGRGNASPRATQRSEICEQVDAGQKGAGCAHWETAGTAGDDVLLASP